MISYSVLVLNMVVLSPCKSRITTVTTSLHVLRLRKPRSWYHLVALQCHTIYHMRTSVDANNNRRDSIISFHNIIETYRLRFVSCRLDLALGKIMPSVTLSSGGCNRDGLFHSDFESRLAHSLLVTVKNTERSVQATEAEPVHT
ncbi:uncharacterized protein EV154DRAFT_480001 [Mucor mucedo]|uniref:uncharacterized protein n=1 Tax=Mucor mucedo TaxID=29922 RepID=UPI00221F9297|nr:uncharacterized protein EV154DRAFT_480001 [Mucor mucedo]KAI7892730.1 hypothetical protein EV154DRAFT_480001 [Mucor mucedo]